MKRGEMVDTSVRRLEVYELIPRASLFFFTQCVCTCSLAMAQRVCSNSLPTTLAPVQVSNDALCVFDLDNTLVYTDMDAQSCPGDGWEVLAVPHNGAPLTRWTYVRPGARELLTLIHDHTDFELAVFTAGTLAYAHAIVALLDPSGKHICANRVFSREDMMGGRHGHKTLTVVAQRANVARTRILVVDDRRDVWHASDKNQVLLVPTFQVRADRLSVETAERYLDHVGDQCRLVDDFLDSADDVCGDGCRYACTLQNAPLVSQSLRLMFDPAIDQQSGIFSWLPPAGGGADDSFWLVDCLPVASVATLHILALPTHVIAHTRNSPLVQACLALPAQIRPAIVTVDWLFTTVLHSDVQPIARFHIA
jgi:hypothetical protein